MIIYFYSNKKKAGKSLILSAFSLLLSNNKIKNIAIKPIFNNSSKDDIDTQAHLNKILNQKTSFEPRAITDIKSKKEISNLMSEINNLDKKYKIVLVEVDQEIKSNITKEFYNNNTKSILINEFSTRLNNKSINEIKNLQWIIYNKIPKYRSTYIKSKIEPKLNKQNLNILAEIPEIRTLNAITIDQIKNDYNIKDINHIKIDVDGFEDRVYKGAIATIQQAKSVLIEIDQKHEHVVSNIINLGLRLESKHKRNSEEYNYIFVK